MESPAQPLKIITLTHEFYPKKGGIAVYVREAAQAAHELGYDIEVWAPRHSELKPGLFPFPVKGLPLKDTQGWPSRVKLAGYLSRHQAEWREAVLWLPEPGPIRAWMYLLKLGFRRPRRLVLTLHGSEIGRLTALPHRRLLFGQLLEAADRVTVVSQYNERVLLEKFPALAGKVKIASGAVRSDLPVMAGEKKSRNGQPGIVVLTVARIHPRKGQLCLLEALARLPEELRGRTVYRLYGDIVDKNYHRRLAAYAKKNLLPLEYLGPAPDARLADIYREADVFALTSLPAGKSVEGFGLVCLEASAFGLPVLAHRTGGVGEAVRHGETGLLVEPADRAALADALRRLVCDDALRQRLGQAGRQWVKNFSWEKTARALFEGLG